MSRVWHPREDAAGGRERKENESREKVHVFLHIHSFSVVLFRLTPFLRAPWWFAGRVGDSRVFEECSAGTGRPWKAGVAPEGPAVRPAKVGINYPNREAAGGGRAPPRVVWANTHARSLAPPLLTAASSPPLFLSPAAASLLLSGVTASVLLSLCFCPVLLVLSAIVSVFVLSYCSSAPVSCYFLSATVWCVLLLLSAPVPCLSCAITPPCSCPSASALCYCSSAPVLLLLSYVCYCSSLLLSLCFCPMLLTLPAPVPLVSRVCFSLLLSACFYPV